MSADDEAERQDDPDPDLDQDDHEDGSKPATVTPSSDKVRRRLIAAGTGLVVFAVAFFIGTEVGCEDPPGEDDLDVGFAQDMQVHHAQAVMMADIIRDKSTDEEVRAVARDILLGQQAQIGEMRGWLEMWDQPATSTRAPMWWIPNHPPEMPGMATTDELTELSIAEGSAADVMFLELMIRHHDGGVHMAEVAAQSAHESAVKQVAQTIADAQLAEITYLQELLDARA